jgi:hypothetical protein
MVSVADVGKHWNTEATAETQRWWIRWHRLPEVRTMTPHRYHNVLVQYTWWLKSYSDHLLACIDKLLARTVKAAEYIVDLGFNPSSVPIIPVTECFPICELGINFWWHLTVIHLRTKRIYRPKLTIIYMQYGWRSGFNFQCHRSEYNLN